MKKLLPILVFMLASASSYAQNWNPLNPGAKRYFTNVYGYLKGMRIDSVAAFGNELHYYPFKTLRGPQFNSDTAGSWLGEDIVKRADGTFLFPNYWNDTIKINSLAQIGDSWTFYADSSNVYYTAEVTAIDTMTVLGIVDSMKRIVLTAFDNDTALVTDSFNNVQIILSKNHGIYQAMELYLFPFHAPDTNLTVDDHYFAYSVKPADFLPPSGPITPGPFSCMFRLVNYIDPVYNDIYDRSVGDIYEYSSCYSYGWNTTPCLQPTFYKLDTIGSKMTFADSVRYTTSGWKAYKPYPQTHFTLVSAAGASTYFNAKVFHFEGQLMPEELDPAGQWNWNWMTPLFYYYPNDESYCTNSPKYAAFFYFNAGLSGATAHIIYKAQVGKVKDYSWVYDGMSPSDADTTLIWFERNGVPCGTYVFPDTVTPVVNSVVNVNGAAAIGVYPNPATEQLTIETALSHYDLVLINAVGQIVYRRPGCDSKQVIDVSGLASGVYQLRMDTEMGDVLYRKVVVQH